MARFRIAHVAGFASVIAALALFSPRDSFADTYPATYNWIGGDSGNLIWDNAANWQDATNNSGQVPGSHGQIYPSSVPPGGDTPVIGDSQGNRTITTPSYATNVYGM